MSFNGAGSSDTDGSITAYAWDFDNNGTTDGTGANTSTTYSNAGSTAVTMTAKLIVTDNENATTNTTRTITVYPASSYGMTVQGGTTSLPYQLTGSTVTVTASAPATGLQFNNWTIVSGSGSFANANSASTTFTMGSADTIVQANYGPDTTAPSIPTGLSSSSSFATSATFSWGAASDNVAVTGYEVFANGVSKGTLTGTSTTLTGLTPNTIYQLTVRARDAAGNWSAQSGALTVQTWQRLFSVTDTLYWQDNYDEENNYIDTTIHARAYGWHSAPSSGTLKIYATGSTDTWGGSNIAANSSSGGEENNFLLTGPVVHPYVPGVGDYYFVVGSDSESIGAFQVFVDFKPNNTGPVASFTATPAFGRAPLSVGFNGSASLDPGGVITSYAWDFDNNGTTDATGQAATTTYANSGSSALTYTAKLTVTGPSGSANTTRTITVYPASSFALTVQNGTTSLPYQLSGSTVSLTATAPAGGGTFTGWTIVSGAGTFANASATSTTFTMGSADTVVRATYGTDSTAPSAPTALNYAERTATTVTLVWRAATDNIGVIGYQIYRGGTLIGSTSDLVFADSGLTANTTYSYTVKALDAAGNLSAASNALNVTTTQDFSADTDQDGIPNATETALGTNAAAAAAADSSNQTQLQIHRPIK